MEQAGLLGQLGIDVKLLLSQAVNFFILLAVLRFFVYKPLFFAVKERNRKIQEGLDKAKEADIRLKEVDHVAAATLKGAEQESVRIIENAKQNGKILENMMHHQVENKQKELMEQVHAGYLRQKEEAADRVMAEAGQLVKKFIAGVVELKPDMIDEALIAKAINAAKKETEQ